MSSHTPLRHIIKQQVLELEMSSDISGLSAIELQNQISALYRSRIVPIIDDYFSQFSNTDSVHRIDRLEIDLGEINIDALAEELPLKFAASLSDQLAQQSSSVSPPQQKRDTETFVTAALSKSTKQPLNQSQQPNQSQRPNQPQQLNQSSQTESPISTRQSRLELLHTFLYTGRLPWWSKPLDRAGLEQRISQILSDSPHQLKVLLLTAIQKETVLQRILYQISEPLRMQLLKLVSPELQFAFQSYLEEIIRLAPQVNLLEHVTPQRLNQTMWQGILWQTALQPSLTGGFTLSQIDNMLRANVLHVAAQLQIDKKSLIQELQRAIAQYPASESSDRTTSRLSQAFTKLSTAKQTVKPEKEDFNSLNTPKPQSELAFAKTVTENNNSDEAIYIYNAGLVLLWPFLCRFFENLNLVESNQFLTPQAPHRATLFLQYLLNQSTEPLESELCLNKLLCGQDLAEPILTDLNITEAEAQACEDLLSATIYNWTALGKISPDGLRQAFLQREGVLRSQGDRWLLQIAHKPHDILLDSLSWSIKVIKLPWMEQAIYADW